MPTAPSFAQFSRMSEPFIKNGKLFIKVKNAKTGTIREVRWYSDTEFAKLYGKKSLEDKPKDGFDGLKHAFGFDHGPMLVIRNTKPSDEEWLNASCARYGVGIGWYIVATDTLPEDAPSHFKYLLFGWDEFRDGDDRHKKTPAQMAAILEKKAHAGQYVSMARPHSI